MLELIEFFQPIDKNGYQIIEVQGFRLSRPTTSDFLVRSRAAQMLAEKMDNEQWCRAGGKIGLAGLAHPSLREMTSDLEGFIDSQIINHFDTVTEKVVVGKSGKSIYLPVHMDEAFKDAFMSFAKVSKTEANVLALVNRYGLPTKGWSGKKFGLDEHLNATPFDHILKTADMLNFVIELHATGSDMASVMKDAVKNIHVSVSSKNDLEIPRIVMEPRDLTDFMLLQFSASVVGKRNLEYCACEKCGLQFSRGPGAERRSNAIYCTDSCRDAANYQKKKARVAAKEIEENAS